jgi:putative salt-induced outer membrane protein YdiY
VSVQQGNTETFDVKLDGEVVYDATPWEFRTSLAFVYGESEGERTAESWHGLLRGERSLGDCRYVFAQVLFDRDEPADLDYRWTGVLGYGCTFVDEPRDRLKGELGVGLVHEKRTDLASTTDPTLYAGLRYEHDWADGSRLFSDLKLLPNVSDFDLSLATLDTGYETPICSWCRLAFGLRLDWVVDPPGDVEPLDLLFTAGVKVEL